ncbi:hypothetical protein AAA799O18_00698 [Marine Group I thaumarchaeote SCGC AAA799-O18]|nr:hypothetical protein AAA799O18_00698 [Marine Group I thaumarchaeote SCGC AAA799-O18]
MIKKEEVKADDKEKKEEVKADDKEKKEEVKADDKLIEGKKDESEGN